MAGITCSVVTAKSFPTKEETGIIATKPAQLTTVEMAIAPFPQVFNISNPTPLAGASITVIAYYNSVTQTFIYQDFIPGFPYLPTVSFTGSNGVGSLCLPRGTFIVKISAPGYIVLTLTITVVEGDTRYFLMQRIPGPTGNVITLLAA